MSVVSLLEVTGLTKSYGDQTALADVAFDAREGEVLGLIGPNDAGKTTLLECVTGLLPADRGEVVWRGIPLAPSPENGDVLPPRWNRALCRPPCRERAGLLWRSRVKEARAY